MVRTVHGTNSQWYEKSSNPVGFQPFRRSHVFRRLAHYADLKERPFVCVELIFRQLLAVIVIASYI